MPPIVIATLVVFFALLATVVYFVRQGLGVGNKQPLARAEALIDAIREEAYRHAEIDHTLSTTIRKASRGAMPGDPLDHLPEADR